MSADTLTPFFCLGWSTLFNLYYRVLLSLYISALYCRSIFPHYISVLYFRTLSPALSAAVRHKRSHPADIRDHVVRAGLPVASFDFIRLRPSLICG